MTEQRLVKVPVASLECQAFFDATVAGKFLIKFCRACGERHFYPRDICPHCLSAETEWQESCGLGEVYSFSVMRRVAEPYAIAYVRLDEGVTVMSNLVNCDLDDLQIGQRVRVVFRSIGGVHMATFTPTKDADIREP